MMTNSGPVHLITGRSWIVTFTRSTVGQKVVMGITGLLLTGFLIMHLLGNLALLKPDKHPFNRYAEFLHSLGTGLLGAEFILATLFLFHIIFGIIITWENRKARLIGYEEQTWAGPPSRRNISSSTKIYTGMLILVFMVIHVWQLKFRGLGGDELVKLSGGAKSITDGMPMLLDFYTFVHLYFHKAWNVFFYSVIMILLGLHLGHGFWSAFQSLGVSHPKYTPIIYRLGYFLGVVIATGFFFIPILIYLRRGGL
jgi:succinate dehydrogenase / fumarate reductase cytochrome b subunit